MARVSPGYAATLGGAAVTGGVLGGYLGSRKQPPKERASKAYRSHDPEHGRQRQLGALEAGLGMGGALMLARGARGTRSATRALRAANKTRPKRPIKASIAANRSDIAYLGGGTAGIAGAAGTANYARSRHNRPWD